MVGYTPGGQADAIARAVAKGLSENLKTPVIVENKPGANGLISAQSVAKADPDGHTLVLVTDAMTTIDPQLDGPAKFDPSANVSGRSSTWSKRRCSSPPTTICRRIRSAN